MISIRRTLGVAAVLAAVVATGAVGVAAAAATAPGGAAAQASGATRPAGAIDWAPCATDATAQCGTLSVPIDWAHPDGDRFDLAVARRLATDPAARVGSLVFGPGGPGDSGVSRILTGMNRFSATLRSRFDIVSFDPRGVGLSHPVTCSAALVAAQPSPLITSPAGFRSLLDYNRTLRSDCREHTGPLFDHVDTMSAVRDLDALRAALGEPRLTFQGASYGTLLGEEYAETFPDRVRAIVLESVDDHSARARSFLESQAATAQDSYDEFVSWCDRDVAGKCALHGQDVRAVTAGLFARASNPFGLMFNLQGRLYTPDWPGLAARISALAGDPADPTPTPPPPPAGASTPFPLAAIFCSDWDLGAHGYREYAANLHRMASLAPDIYPRATLAAAMCVGQPPVAFPQHPLRVHVRTPLLLVNSLHDPATGYDWAANVARQLGRAGVLVTYEGWGHGSYGVDISPCVRGAVDRYLTTLEIPARGTRCPAMSPPGA
jgi:pimeloyl-ACP methyl ester carboxylesterase